MHVRMRRCHWHFDDDSQKKDRLWGIAQGIDNWLELTTNFHRRGLASLAVWVDCRRMACSRTLQGTMESCGYHTVDPSPRLTFDRESQMEFLQGHELGKHGHLWNMQTVMFSESRVVNIKPDRCYEGATSNMDFSRCLQSCPAT